MNRRGEQGYRNQPEPYEDRYRPIDDIPAEACPVSPGNNFARNVIEASEKTFCKIGLLGHRIVA